VIELSSSPPVKEVPDMNDKKTEKEWLKAIMVVSLMIVGVVSISGMAFAEEYEQSFLDGNLVLKTGTIDENNTSPWDENKNKSEIKADEMGDYIAFKLSNDAWFYILYGTEEHPNSIMMATFQLRYLGGATIMDPQGNIIVEKIGIPVVTVYGHKFFSFIEFQDVGYREKNMFMEEVGEVIGADNDLWDFKRNQTGLGNMEHSFTSTEPVIKALDLNTSWNRSEIDVIPNEDPNIMGFDFALTAENLEYGDGNGNVWDPEFVNDNTTDTCLEEVTISFHIEVSVEEGLEIKDIPWYEVEVDFNGGEDPTIGDTKSVEKRDFKGIAVNADYKYDHYIKGWDFKNESRNSKLMLESFTIFGTFVPDIVNEWFDKQFVTGIEGALGVAEYEYDNAGEMVDAAISDPREMPESATLVAKEHITFKDNWHRMGELSWISDVDVDGETDFMFYQVHAGQNQQGRGENDDGFGYALIIMGGYIYPAGNEIFHDPTFSCGALIIEGLSTISLNVLSTTGVCLQFAVATVAIAVAITISIVRKRRRKKDKS
jgi:hypothetical protein